MALAETQHPAGTRPSREVGAILVAGYLALLLVVPGAVWVGIIGLIVLAGFKLRPLPNLTGSERAVGIALLALLVAALLSYISNPLTASGFMTVWHFGLAPVMFGVALVAVRQDTLSGLWMGATAAAALAGVLAAVQVALGESRPSGFVASPISFGALALLFGFVSFATCEFSGRSRAGSVALSWTALVLGLLASTLSASRTCWLALPAVLAILAYQNRGRLTGRQISAAFAALGGVVVGGLILTRGFILVRAAAVVTELTGYFGADPSEPARGSSIGSRLEMWRVSVDAFGDHPWFGIGWGHLEGLYDGRVEEGLSHWRIGEYIHAHNQYVSSLSSGGVLGFATVIAALSVPGWVCLRALRGSDLERRALGGVGMLFVVSFSLLALTESVFEDVPLLVAYALVIGLVIAGLARRTAGSVRRDPLARRV